MINKNFKMSAKGGSASGGKDLYILGSKINDISLTEVIAEIQELFSINKKGYIVTPNPEICLVGYKDKQFRRITHNSFISIPDGFGLKLGARILGSKLKNLTTGIDLCWELLKLAEQNSYSVLFLGGKQETGERVKNLLKQKYPNLKTEYINGGQFDSQGNSTQSNLINLINSIKPDITFVCLGAPKQEYFMSRNLESLETKLMLGVGGSIDFLAGEIKRAPNSWRKLRLEWLWRLNQEPWRWKRILRAVIIFPLACLRWRFGNLFIYRNNVAGMIINDEKKILIGFSCKFHYWQLPQGGVKKGESLEKAIIRESSDEIGSTNLKIMDKFENCFKYKFRQDYWYTDKYKGQKQSLFLIKFIGNKNEIKPSAEFSNFQWVGKEEILDIVSPNKKEIIQIGLDKFKKYL
ncbi:MAG: WecB/TagA/CpsF family glycosyltransferase [Candidatus Parcubacteria bacterium]|nr:WecB/TagA/CpsF family glycosyltransferase [Candidatus Parcubacteria bacterium]